METKLKPIFEEFYEEGGDPYNFRRVVFRAINKFLYTNNQDYRSGILGRTNAYHGKVLEKNMKKYKEILGIDEDKMENPISGYKITIGGKTFMKLVREGVIKC